ncbi:CBS domain-containing protein [Streptomyces spiralis]|uniref:CBS domain-containing protein n=1 Tax=Streptomyces spiralis TaxID=66376 RepID=UPI003675CB5A
MPNDLGLHVRESLPGDEQPDRGRTRTAPRDLRSPGGDGRGDLMTSPAVVAEPGWHAVRAARTMERHKVKRLPVVDGHGRLIGVISRSDLVRLFLRRDRAIQEEILEDVIVRTLGLPPSALTVEVAEGRVPLSGTVEHKSLIPILVRLCDSVDGVVEVVNRLGFDQDDTVDRTAGHDGVTAAAKPVHRGERR